MSISFNTIPINVLTPGSYVEFDNSRAFQGLPAIAHKVLLMGQRLSTGAVAAGVPTRMLSSAQAEEAFGRSSMLAAMVAAFKAANAYTECWAVALDDAAGGVLATGTLTFTGAATEGGTLALYVGGRAVPVALAAGAAPAAVAAAVVAALNAAGTLPVVATAAAGVVTLTARHKGEAANALDVRLNYYLGERTPKGLAVAMAAMAGGTVNPDVAPALAAMGDEHFHTLVVPYTDASNLTKVEAALAARFGPMVQREAHAFAAVAGSHAAMAALGAARNSPHLTLMAAGKSPTPPWAWAAVVAAVDSAEPDPARPRQTLALPGLLPAAVAERLSREDRNVLLGGGVATTVVDAGGQVLVERLTTTYQLDAFGVADVSYRDVETMRTLAYLRLSVRARIAQRYPRHKLANDGTRYGAGQAIVTPGLLRAELVALFAQWEEAGLVEGMEQFKRDLLVERSSTDANRVDAVIPPDVINQLRVFAASVQFRL